MFLAGLEVVRDTSNVRERLQISLLILNEVKRIKFHSIGNPMVFCFQGVQKETSGMEWVNDIIMFISHIIASKKNKNKKVLEFFKDKLI